MHMLRLPLFLSMIKFYEIPRMLRLLDLMSRLPYSSVKVTLTDVKIEYQICQ